MGAFPILRQSIDHVVVVLHQVQAVLKARAGDPFDGVDGYIDSQPLAVEPARSLNCGSTATERIKYYVAGIAASANYAIKKRKRFLCRVPETFFRLW